MPNSMSGRERLQAALRGKPVDRIPLSFCVDNFFADSLPAQGFPVDIIGILRYLKNDIMERHVPIYQTEYDREISVEEKFDGNDVMTTYKTPVGDIYQIYTRTANGGTDFVSKHLVDNIEDARVYKYLYEHKRFIPDYETFMEHDRIIGDDGMATPSAPHSPIQILLQHIAGIQNTIFMLEDYPDEMEELFDMMFKKDKEVYDIVAKSDAFVCFNYEDTSTTVMSRNQFVKYSAPCIDAYADILHSAGKVFITHMCGKLRGFADLVKAGRQDGVDCLCPPTTGDFWAHEARACWGDGKVIIGGMEPPKMVFMDEKESIRYTVDVLNNIAPGNAFILCSGDSVSSGTPVANLSAIAEVVLRYGAYPLTGKIDAATAVKEILQTG